MQPWDYVHKPGNDGLTVENFVARLNSVAGAPIANRMLAQPWFTGDLPMRVLRLGIRVTTGGATNQRIGIYTSTSTRNLYPDALVVDLGIVNYAATGNIFVPNNDFTLAAGSLYWIATIADAALGQHNAIAGGGNEENLPAGPLGSIGTAPNPPTNAALVWNVARTYASGFPATFTAGGTGADGTNVPAIIWEPF